MGDGLLCLQAPLHHFPRCCLKEWVTVYLSSDWCAYAGMLHLIIANITSNLVDWNGRFSNILCPAVGKIKVRGRCEVILPSHPWGKHNFPFLLPKSSCGNSSCAVVHRGQGSAVLAFMCCINTCAPLQRLSGVVWKCSLLFRINSAQGCESFQHHVLHNSWSSKRFVVEENVFCFSMFELDSYKIIHLH